MNKFVFCSLSLIAGAAAHLGAAEISSDLQAKIANKGASKVIITFKDKTNRGKLKFKGSAAEVRRTLSANYKASSAEVKSLFKSVSKQGGGQVISELPFANAMVANVSNVTLRDLAKNPNIAQITLDRVIMFEETPEVSKSHTTTFSEDWTYGLKKVGVDKVRAAYNLTGKGVRVGILDTGIDAEHPDLKGKVVAWKDWAGTSATPKDAHGHGTHCAGTIAGGDASGKNIGVAPDVELVIARIFGDNGGATLSGILGAMNWITDPDSNPDTDDAPPPPPFRPRHLVLVTPPPAPWCRPSSPP
ncbi:S8 family serine peptidase, partial [bacterium]|nr:S8 family serine peptidase [bacterium]